METQLFGQDVKCSFLSFMLVKASDAAQILYDCLFKINTLLNLK